MDTTALLLSRLQFAFTVSFHIIYPSFTIGLAAWLTVLEALHLASGRPAYRMNCQPLVIISPENSRGHVLGLALGCQHAALRAAGWV